MRTAISVDCLQRLYDRIAPGYDLRHALLTARADQRGRRMLVDAAVRPGDSVLDCGAGTGSTALLAAKAAGPEGSVTLFDLGEGMLAVARDRAARLGLADRLAFRAGDMARLPFADGSFDTVPSTCSPCLLYDPAADARVLMERRIGVPLWPFLVFVVEKAGA